MADENLIDDSMQRIENLYWKLTRIQNDLKAPKSQYNSYGKYAYRSAEDIMEAIKPLLLHYGCALKVEEEIVLIEPKNNPGCCEDADARYYVKSSVTLIDCDDCGLRLTVSAYAREDSSKKGMDGAQITGAASSYARKYALCGLFLIDDTKDPDAMGGQVYQNGKTKAQAVETAQKGASPLHEAKAALMDAIKRYADRHDTSAEALSGGIAKRMDYQERKDDPQWYLDIAREFDEA